MNEIQSKYTTSLALLIKYRALRKQGQFHEDVCKALGVASSTMYQWNNPKTSFLIRDVPVLTKGRSGYSQEDRNAAVKAYYDMIGKGANMSQVCALLGIDLKTMKDWINKSINTHMGKTTVDTAPTAPAQNATTQHVAALTERLAELESKAENYAAHAYERHAEIKTRVDALEGKMDNWIEPQTVAGIKEWRNIVDRFDALEAAQDARAVPALAEMCTDLAARVQSLEHAAQDAHQALYDARERLLALETRDTEPTPFHAVDRTYVLVIAILVITVAITLVTVLL